MCVGGWLDLAAGPRIFLPGPVTGSSDAAMQRDAARAELEEKSGGRYFLDLTVKVRADWRDDERFLARLVTDPERA